jgi:hypothetical protein
MQERAVRAADRVALSSRLRAILPFARHPN